ncbi:hypothetical protein H7T43_01460 [Peribacillus simplex]|uniref:hypothetical protein n=1 Tax=Peribacillus simplex TaxID=1478 RepID=UPI0029899F0B|nr:hypothetical protein [Peribacillus simplex]MBX9953576.1 hypothetical protein [Peribacillus simplex]
MAKTVKNEKMKKMPLTANMSQLLISKKLDKKFFNRMDHEYHHQMKISVNYTQFSNYVVSREMVEKGGQDEWTGNLHY